MTLQKSFSIIVVLLVFPSLLGADKKRMTVVDYFLLLPPHSLESAPVDLLDNCNVIDRQNGFMSCIGDGAQPNFQVALFKYRDRRSLLALCQGEEAGGDSLFLDFFEMAPDGKMHKTSRSIFPVADAGSEKGNWRFELPRHGRIVLVRGQKSGKILRKFTWNGDKFVEQK